MKPKFAGSPIPEILMFMHVCRSESKDGGHKSCAVTAAQIAYEPGSGSNSMYQILARSRLGGTISNLKRGQNQA